MGPYCMLSVSFNPFQFYIKKKFIFHKLPPLAISPDQLAQT